MSTTVTYMGNTLTTVDNATKTLETAGTWLEDDITLTDVSSGGGVDLSWIAASTPTPSVRNFFYALANGNIEHGEFTLSSQPNNAFVDLFTMTNFSDANPPQGIIFVDKDFYQGITGLTQNFNEWFSFAWFDKSFINPASDTNPSVTKYMAVRMMANQQGTSATNNGNTNFVSFDGTTAVFRAKWQFSGNNVQVKFDYNNQNQYTPFLRGRTYIWIVY